MLITTRAALVAALFVWFGACSRDKPKTEAKPHVSAKGHAAKALRTAAGEAPRSARQSRTAKSGTAWAVASKELAKHPHPKRSTASAQRHRVARRAALAKKIALTPTFSLVYGTPEDDGQAKQLKALKDAGFLTPLVAQLNANLKLKRSILINIAACGEANAYYDTPPKTPDGKIHPGEITICFEFMEHMLSLFIEDGDTPAEAAENMTGVLLFTLFHELGHGLVDNLKLHTTGREEDAVDQLATLMLLRLGERGGFAAIASAEAFALEHDEQDEEDVPLWDEHALDLQRMYEGMCLIYGSNPTQFKGLVGKDGLPKERAENCEETFKATARSWDGLLKPHLKRPGGLRFTLPE